MKFLSVKHTFLILLSTLLLMTVIKHHVQEIDRKISEMETKSKTNWEEIKILEAELALLSRPERIEKLSRELLNLNFKPLIVTREINYLSQFIGKSVLHDER